MEFIRWFIVLSLSGNGQRVNTSHRFKF